MLGGLDRGGYRDLTCYSEVIQDSMLRLIKDGAVAHASATALALSEKGLERVHHECRLLPQPHHAAAAGDQQPPRGGPPLGIIAMNGMLEADIYGNVNSTHVMGTRIMNGIGGPGTSPATATCRCS